MQSSLLTKLAFAALIILAVGQIPNYVTATPAVATPAPVATEAVWGEASLGEIQMFAGNFAPRGYAKCEGQLLSISQYSALFSLLGTTYGGDGRTTFGLPDLRGRTPLGAGRGPGLNETRLGERAGVEQTTLRTQNITVKANVPAPRGSGRTQIRPSGGASGQAGGGDAGQQTVAQDQNFTVVAPQDVNLEQPSLGVTYIIAVQGIFPSRSK